MATKVNTRNTGIITRDEYTATLDDIAEMTVRRDKIQAKIDKAILDAREEYAGEMERLNNLIAAKLAQAEAYASRNRDTLLPSGAKTGETAKARWGFRLGNPTLVLLSRKFTWASVVAKLSDLGMTTYLKVTAPKPDKDRLKADLDDAKLAELGLRIDQSESFWIEPKTDSAERINSDQ